EIRLTSELARRLRATAHITQAQSREKKIERMKVERQQLLNAQREGHLGRVNATQLNLQRSDHVSAEIAVAEHATKSFGERELFHDISFLIRGGEHVAIVGENGCGKTTLLRILLGLDQEVKGVCRIGSWVRVGLLDQNAEFENERRTMLGEVIHQKEQLERPARDLLSKVGFYGDEIYKEIEKLSGGERVRLKLALLLQQEPQCLVLDEPTNHLDLPAREAVEKAIATFKGTVIAVSHDRYFLNRCATRILAFEGKTIKSYDGNWDDYRAAITPLKENEITKKQHMQSVFIEKPSDHTSQAALEAEIAQLEAHKQKLVEMMGPEADPSVYTDYQQVESALEELYNQWVTE
ncbi:MAG: ATP-binding cassette domain-containing protein, partial [Phycisphaerales bacterium]|nr:ATP-binding cassette domain-containing protein [Phycisphaerales bacterium]